MLAETERQDVRHQWRRENQDQHKAHETRQLTSECARSLLVSSCCRHTHSLHNTSRAQVSSCPRVCTPLIHAWSERHSSTFELHSIQLHTLLILLQSPAARAALQLVYSANNEMVSADESCSHTGYESKDNYLMETYVESLTESVTQQQFTEQRSRSRRCFTTHTENMSITPSEKACLGQSSSSSVSERTGRPVVERTGRPVVERGQELNTEHA